MTAHILEHPSSNTDVSSRPATRKSIAELLLPLQEAVSQSGHTEEEAVGFFEEALCDVREQSRRQKTDGPSIALAAPMMKSTSTSPS